jgi:hypothetical protein
MDINHRALLEWLFVHLKSKHLNLVTYQFSLNLNSPLRIAISDDTF